MFAALLLLIDLPGQPPSYPKPQSATDVRYIEFLEDNTHLIYPALAVLALVAIILGILQAYRSEDMSGVEKAEIKRDIIRELRRQVGGMTVDDLARAIAVPSLKVLKILEELQKENIVDTRTNTRRLTTWRMKL